MKVTDIRVCPLAPSAGQIPDIIRRQFEWRKTGRFDGVSTIQFGDVKEPLW